MKANMIKVLHHLKESTDDCPAHEYSHLLYIQMGAEVSREMFDKWYEEYADTSDYQYGHDNMIWDSYIELVKFMGV